MSAMTLPALNPTPIPTFMVAPPSPAAGNAAGPGSFSRLLRAADAHRQPEAPEAAASPPPNPQSKAQNTTNGTRPPPPTQKAPSREGSKTERAAGQADADNNTAERRRAEEADAASAAEECTAPTDAASLLASLGQRAAVVLAAHGVRDGAARWTDRVGWTYRTAQLSGSAGAATRERVSAELADMPGIAGVVWVAR